VGEPLKRINVRLFRLCSEDRKKQTGEKQNMKRNLLLGFAFCLTLTACGRIYGPVEEVKAFAEEKEEVISQMGKKLEANPTEAGVDEARKIFEAKRGSLKAKREAIDAAPKGFNADWQSLLWKTEKRHEEMWDAIAIKFKVACYSDQCEKKWLALEKEFQETTARK
jgi:hypothetical protein